MKENKRCSILFHLLVPGGKWQTEISRPASSVNCCSSHFHNLTRAPLLPPESLADSSGAPSSATTGEYSPRQTRRYRGPLLHSPNRRCGRDRRRHRVPPCLCLAGGFRSHARELAQADLGSATRARHS